MNFGDIARSLRDIASGLKARRVWLLLDEWSSVPLDVQPYLAAFIVRCVAPLQEFTVKIAAIEKQPRFRATIDGGQPIGIELGADFAANVDLDEFMVFEQDSERSRDFFRGLLFKHLTAGAEERDRIVGLDTERELISKGFTGRPAFDELVRASEGVPRDAINIAAKAAVHAGEKPISTPHVRKAARQWFQSDKEAALTGVPGGIELLNWVYDEVIRGKRARGFLVSQRFSNDLLLNALFDARVLHLVRRGYSARRAPGERYDVYLIDFGAYVDLINTQAAPQELSLLDLEGSEAPENRRRYRRRRQRFSRCASAGSACASPRDSRSGRLLRSQRNAARQRDGLDRLVGLRALAFGAGPRAAQQRIACRRQRVVVDVAVHPQRHRRVVAEPLGRRRDGSAAVEHPRGGGVPGVVQPDDRPACCHHSGGGTPWSRSQARRVNRPR